MLNHYTTRPHLRTPQLPEWQVGGKGGGFLGRVCPCAPDGQLVTGNIEGPHWALPTPPTWAASYLGASSPPFMSEVEPVQFRLNGFCRWLRQHVLRGVGPCPVLPVAPPGAPPAWLGGVPRSSSLITCWGWQGRAWGPSPEAWAPQDTQNLRVPRRWGFLAPLIKIEVSETKILAPLALDPALRSDESALRSSFRQTDRWG